MAANKTAAITSSSASPTSPHSTTSLERLPYEILAKVCEAISVFGSTVEGKNALSNLRLTCRRLRHIPLPYICNRFEVGLWGDHGLKKLCSQNRPRHLAALVKSLVLRINFNLAEPHPAPYTRTVQRRYSRGPVDPFAEDTSALQNKVQRLVLKPFRKRSEKPTQGEAEGFLQSPKDPHDVIDRFQDVVTQIIFRNLGFTSGGVTQLSPLFLSFIGLVSHVLSSFPKLETLELDNDLQEEFMLKLRFPDVLRWSPAPATWQDTTEQVTAALLCAFVCCDNPTLRSLRILGSGRNVLRRWQENVSLLPEVNGALMQDRLQQKLESLRTISFHYDQGAYPGRIDNVGTSFPADVIQILQQCAGLEDLAIQFHSRDHGNDPRIDEILSPATGIRYFSSLSHLRTLTLGNTHYGRGSDLIELLAPLSSTLEELGLGSSSIGSDPTWQSVVYKLRHEFELTKFRLRGLRYYAGSISIPSMTPIPAGSWVPNRFGPGRLLVDIERYVEGRDDGDSLVSEADEVAVWPQKGDETWRWWPSSSG